MEWLSEAEQTELDALRVAGTWASEVLKQIDRMAGNEIFQRAPKTKNLLNWVAAMQLLGRSHEIKEVSIADAGWPGLPNYDPAVHHHVRECAGELRKKLDLYYKDRGRGDPVEIRLPERGYVPEMTDRRVTLGFEKFCSCHANCDLKRLCAFTRDEIANQLIQAGHPLLRVVTGNGAKEGTWRYSLRACLESQAEVLRLNLWLRDRGAGATLLWETFTTSRDDLFKMSRHVAEAILKSLGLDDCEDYSRDVQGMLPERFETQHRIQQGRFCLRGRTKMGIRLAMELFEQAIVASPRSARAYSGLAECYLLLSWYEVSPPVLEWFQCAKDYAQKAVELNPELPEVHTVLAYAQLLSDFGWAAAEEIFLRAIRIDGSHAPAHHWYGNLLVMQARFPQAEAEMQRAVDLDPGSAVIRKAFGDPYYYSQRYAQAITSYQAALKKDPTFWMAHLFTGLAQEQLGQWEAALESFQTANGLAKGSSVAQGAIGHLYAVTGRRLEAQSIANQLQSQPEAPYVAPHTLAVIYSGLGDKDQAFEWLNASLENRIEMLAWAKVDPRFDALQDDPRWEIFLSKIGLAGKSDMT